MILALRKFRVRSAQRDGDTDRGRQTRLLACVDQILVEISAEADGLQRRYASSQANAAFLSEAAYNESVSEDAAGSRLDGLESQMAACEQRLAELGRQRRSLDGVREQLASALRIA